MHSLSSTTTKDGTIQASLVDCKRKWHFFFPQVSIQKCSSESFFGPANRVPQKGFIFVTPFGVFPRPNMFGKLERFQRHLTQTLKTRALCPFHQTKVENHDEQTARWHPMVHLDPGGRGVVYLWPSFGSGLQTFYTSHHSRAFHVWLRWSRMIHIDPGARCVYLFIQKCFSESFFGPAKGLPQKGFIFVTFSGVFPMTNIFGTL